MLRRATPEDADALAAILRAAMQKAMPSLPVLHTPDEFAPVKTVAQLLPHAPQFAVMS